MTTITTHGCEKYSEPKKGKYPLDMGKIQSCWSMSQNSWPTTFCVSIMMHRICLEQHLVEVAMTIHCSHCICALVITLGGVMSMTVFWSVKWECKIEAIKSEYGGKKWFWLGSTVSAFSFRHKNPRIFMGVLCAVEKDTLFSYFGQKTCQFSNFIAQTSRFRSM